MICRELRDQIESGHLVPGDRIPSEAEMMLLFDVSKMTAARARQQLSLLDMITTVPGIGSFVSVKGKLRARHRGATCSEQQ